MVMSSPIWFMLSSPYVHVVTHMFMSSLICLCHHSYVYVIARSSRAMTEKGSGNDAVMIPVMTENGSGDDVVGLG